MSRPVLSREAAPARPRPRRFGKPAPAVDTVAQPMRLPVWAVAVGLSLILGTFAIRCVGVARSYSITSDESTHLTHCIHYWETGDDLRMWELGAPRLPHVLSAWASDLALHQAGILPAPAGVDRQTAITQIVLWPFSRVLLPARLVAIGWGLALLSVVFWGVARTRGAVIGLAATALLAMVPELLAHSAIAGSDIPFTAAGMLALVLLARYAEHPSLLRWLAVALAVGLAWAMRHTALLLLPLAAGVHGWCALRARPRGWLALAERLVNTLGASIGLAAIAYLVLWAGDGFGLVTVADASESITRLNIPQRMGRFDLSGLPVPTSILSILKQVSHQNRGHEAYFCGEYRQQGWPLYFPVAFLLKTPVGLLLLMAIAIARFRPRLAWEWICVAFVVLLWLTLVRNKVNIGVRYAVLTYPLVLPLLARLFEGRALRDRVWGPITLAATLWFAVASAACHPRYLSYFNEIGGGPRQGWLYLADSNIDWGQDFDALAARLRRLGITDVTTDLSSERRLVEPGLVALPFAIREYQKPAETPPNRRLYDSDGGYLPVYTRFMAVSVSRLLGLYNRNDMSWLRTRRVVARVGDSVFVFDMDTPANRPLCP